MQIENQGVEIEFELLNNQRRMTGAVEAVVTTIIILVLFQGRAWTLVRFGNFRGQGLIAC